jgi:hypothetical protein
MFSDILIKIKPKNNIRLYSKMILIKNNNLLLKGRKTHLSFRGYK